MKLLYILILRLLCVLFGHDYVVERVLSPRDRKLGCTRCLRKWAMHDPTRSLVQWDEEFEELYAPGGILAQASGDVPPNVGLERIVVGKYTITHDHPDGDYWIEHESGEGMHVFKENFEKIIDEYYKSEF